MTRRCSGVFGTGFKSREGWLIFEQSVWLIREQRYGWGLVHELEGIEGCLDVVLIEN